MEPHSSPLCGRAAELTARLTGGLGGARVNPTESRGVATEMARSPPQAVDSPAEVGPQAAVVASPPASPPATTPSPAPSGGPIASSTLHTVQCGSDRQLQGTAAVPRPRRMSLPNLRTKPFEAPGEPLPLGGSATGRRKSFVGALNNLASPSALRSSTAPPARMSHTSPNVIRASLEKAEADGVAARLSLHRRSSRASLVHEHKLRREILEIQVKCESERMD